MSFLTDVFEGNFGNLGNDLSPSNIFSDTASSFANQPEWAKIAEVALPAIAAPFVLPELLPAAGAAAEGGFTAADWTTAGLDLGTIGQGVDATGAAIGSGVAPTTAGLSDAAITNLASSPGASAFAQQPSDLVTMGGDPAVGATAGPGSAPIDVNAGVSGVQAPPITDPGAAPPDAGYAVYNNGQPVGVQGAAPFAQPPSQPSGFVEGFQSGLGTPGSFGASVGKALANPLTDLGIAGLGYNLYSGYEQSQANKKLAATETAYQNSLAQAAATATQAAQPLLTSGEALTQYISTGTLPTGLSNLVQQQIASAKAARIQAAASMGQSTDPKFNTALAQDLAAIDSQGVTLTTQLEQQLATAGTQMTQTANQLIQTGASTTQIAAQLPIMVQELNIKLSQITGQSIASFAAALNGQSRFGFGTGGQGVNINLSGLPTGATATAQ